jgi:hypothetical protein
MYFLNKVFYLLNYLITGSFEVYKNAFADRFTCKSIFRRIVSTFIPPNQVARSYYDSQTVSKS